MSNRPIQSMQIKHIDLLGNTCPLKVNRKLQGMSHYLTNQTCNTVLPGTMTQLSAQPQITPRRHK